jgi:hypothetical protein
MNANMVISTTTTTPAHSNAAVPTTFETTATPKRLNREVDAQHITPVPALSEVKLTTTTTATDSNNATMMDEQQDNQELTMGREEEQAEKEGVREQEGDTGEQEKMQSEV